MSRRRPLLLLLLASLLAAAPLTLAKDAQQAPARAEAIPSQPVVPSAKAVDAMRLLESTDPYQRQLGFLRLEALREPATLEPIHRYVNHRDPELRAYSLRALAAIDGANAIALLLHQLKTDKQAIVRQAALLGLEPLQAADPQILPAFLAALRDRNTEVRMTAVDIVSRIDDPRARQAIFQRNKHERRRDVRRVLSLAMKRIAK